MTTPEKVTADRIYLIQVQANAVTDAQAEELAVKLWDTAAAYCAAIGVDWVGSSHIETA